MPPDHCEYLKRNEKKPCVQQGLKEGVDTTLVEIDEKEQKSTLSLWCVCIPALKWTQMCPGGVGRIKYLHTNIHKRAKYLA
jgi:hypothetical protein